MKAFLEQERDDSGDVGPDGRRFFRTMLEVRIWHDADATMEEDLRTFLVADPGAAALLGDRFIWAARPQGEVLPCCILHRITGAPGYHMQGSDGLAGSLVQIDHWAETWLAAKQAARAVKAALAPLAES